MIKNQIIFILLICYGALSASGNPVPPVELSSINDFFNNLKIPVLEVDSDAGSTETDSVNSDDDVDENPQDLQVPKNVRVFGPCAQITPAKQQLLNESNGNAQQHALQKFAATHPLIPAATAAAAAASNPRSSTTGNIADKFDLSSSSSYPNAPSLHLAGLQTPPKLQSLSEQEEKLPVEKLPKEKLLDEKHWDALEKILARIRNQSPPPKKNSSSESLTTPASPANQSLTPANPSLDTKNGTPTIASPIRSNQEQNDNQG